MSLYESLKEVITSGLTMSLLQSNELFDAVDQEIVLAETNDDYDAKLSLNRSLYYLYKLYWSKSAYQHNMLEQSVVLFDIRVRIEQYLKRSSDRKIDKSLIDNIPKSTSEFMEYINNAIEMHPSYAHYIYEEFIPNKCDLEQLRYYFVQETTMDINTDDFLALLQLGCERKVKPEIARNYWDEMGNGKYEKMHSLLFEGLFGYLGADPNIEIEDITLEALVCGNLQLLVSLYRKYFAYGAGFFYPCEHMASGRFAKAITAWERISLDIKGLVYHKLHVPLDIIHAKNWMSNVLIPYSNIHPEHKDELLCGVMYRLNSSFDYLNMLSTYWGVPSKSGVNSMETVISA